MITKKCVLGIAAFAMMWPVLATADEGRPVTAADLSGKTVCWGIGGYKVTYYSNGTESNNRGRHSTWSIPEPGVVKFGRMPKPGLVEFHYNYVPMVVLPDGRFLTHRFNPRNTFTPSIYNDGWGIVCN